MTDQIQPLSDALLRQLRCPETRQPLAVAGDETLARIREVSGNPGDGALIREDGRRAYPIRAGFPILLLDEAIDVPPA